MKTLLAVILLLTTTVASAGVNPMDRFGFCTTQANRTVAYTVRASLTPNVLAFKKFVQQDADKAPNPAVANLIKFLADFAWSNRTEDPLAVGTAVYQDCIKELSTTT